MTDLPLIPMTRLEVPHRGRPAPYSADIRRVVRQLEPGALAIEVGLRAGTLDARAWDDEIDDLEDTRPLAEALKLARDVEGPLEFDLYVYGGNLGQALLGNVILERLPTGTWWAHGNPR